MIYRLIVLVGAAFVATASPSSAKIIVTTEGVGPVQIGMTPAQTEKAMGGKLEPPPAVELDCSYSRGPGSRYSKMLFGFREGRLFAIELSNRLPVPEAVTTRGIHIGSSLEELLRSYRSNDIKRRYFDEQKDTEMYVRSENYKTAIKFVLEDNKVEEISVGDTELLGRPPSCAE